ncbi:histidine phosphatase family protein [Frateuria aurantia]|uniref:Fructose-2,6-bisphosphatase n=1 Tax=Frateuria aurantia (strain ATCC 33424 / DSM 6220 / KCTC 2777 / LMG 1558 / NBRC 3245 / NCIMB 13370) TaxID=767434 RepID=H8L553_FRAAD|nr:histidine phosphatase family protein [Frateuria aurantia]AFC86632.1 fructose-2,6-bisphosphatase [Frateuria aurantia DSM 6220]
MTMTVPTTRVNEIWLIRHGETAWSLSGQHTGRTDIPLTGHGREQAEGLRPVLAGAAFDHVFCSPLARARTTCELAGWGEQAQIEPRLLEWDYGIYEGRTTVEIRQHTPGWRIWDSPVEQGEDLAAIQARAMDLMHDLLPLQGRVALFAHAHILRVLAGCWIADAGAMGAHLVLGTASVSVLGFDRETRAIRQWNATHY